MTTDNDDVRDGLVRHYRWSAADFRSPPAASQPTKAPDRHHRDQFKIPIYMQNIQANTSLELDQLVHVVSTS